MPVKVKSQKIEKDGTLMTSEKHIYKFIKNTFFF